MSHDSSPAVWQWRKRTAVNGLGIEASRLRKGAVIQALVTAAAGLLVRFVLGHHTFALVLWILAAAVLLLGLAWPSGYRPVHRFGAWLGMVVGGALLYILLVPLYYLVFFPVAMVMRLRGQDPLVREIRDPRYTIWTRRVEPDEEPDYRRQFLVEDKQALTELRPVSSPQNGEAS